MAIFGRFSNGKMLRPLNKFLRYLILLGRAKFTASSIHQKNISCLLRADEISEKSIGKREIFFNNRQFAINNTELDIVVLEK